MERFDSGPKVPPPYNLSFCSWLVLSAHLNSKGRIFLSGSLQKMERRESGERYSQLILFSSHKLNCYKPSLVVLREIKKP